MSGVSVCACMYVRVCVCACVRVYTCVRVWGAGLTGGGKMRHVAGPVGNNKLKGHSVRLRLSWEAQLERQTSEVITTNVITHLILYIYIYIYM